MSIDFRKKKFNRSVDSWIKSVQHELCQTVSLNSNDNLLSSLETLRLELEKYYLEEREEYASENKRLERAAEVYQEFIQNEIYFLGHYKKVFHRQEQITQKISVLLSHLYSCAMESQFLKIWVDPKTNCTMLLSICASTKNNLVDFLTLCNEIPRLFFQGEQYDTATQNIFFKELFCMQSSKNWDSCLIHVCRNESPDLLADLILYARWLLKEYFFDFINLSNKDNRTAFWYAALNSDQTMIEQFIQGVSCHEGRNNSNFHSMLRVTDKDNTTIFTIRPKISFSAASSTLKSGNSITVSSAGASSPKKL